MRPWVSRSPSRSLAARPSRRGRACSVAGGAGRRRRAPQLLCIDASTRWRSPLGAGRGVLPARPGPEYRAGAGAGAGAAPPAAPERPPPLQRFSTARPQVRVPPSLRPSRGGHGLAVPAGFLRPAPLNRSSFLRHQPSDQGHLSVGRLAERRESPEPLEAPATAPPGPERA